MTFNGKSHILKNSISYICGVEPRWKTNCQRQYEQNHQDLKLTIWRLQVDADMTFN